MLISARGRVCARRRVRAATCCLAGVLVAVAAGRVEAAADWLPVSCRATQTVGMHDYPGAEERYHASVFFENAFELRENVLFMQHLLDDEATRVGLYLTLSGADGAETEFECRPVRGSADNEGFSCVNNPPSEMLLVNPGRGRFTRGAIGGWTFYGAREEQHGASLFVEFGKCVGLDVADGAAAAEP